MNRILRFYYLNIYSFLLLFLSFVIIAVPLYKITAWLLVLQIILAIYIFIQSIKLFSSWQDKKIKYKILMGKNKNEFRPETFKAFMQIIISRKSGQKIQKIANLQYYKSKANYGTKKKGISR